MSEWGILRIFYLFVHMYHISECSGLRMEEVSTFACHLGANNHFQLLTISSPVLTLALLHAACICTIYSLYLGKICSLSSPTAPRRPSMAYVTTSGSTCGEKKTKQTTFLQSKS